MVPYQYFEMCRLPWFKVKTLANLEPFYTTNMF